MATSKRKLVEQIRRRLSGGNLSVAVRIHDKEIEEACMQAVNSFLRPQYFENLQITDGFVPEGCVIATYDNIQVEAWKDVSRITLPAIPVSLPKNMGVWRIYAMSGDTDGEFTTEFSDEFNVGSGGPVTEEEYIPLPNGQFSFIKQQRLISDLLGQTGYRLSGKHAIFTRNLLMGSPAITYVTVEMVVMDLSQYSDYELLPINADMEAQVVDSVFKMFAPEPVHPQIVDSTSDTK